MDTKTMLSKRCFKIAVILAVMLLALCVCSCTFAHKIDPSNDDIKVAIVQGEGFSISGSNVVSVSPGKTATFDISFDQDHMYIGNSAGGYYDEKKGQLVFSAVKYPMTVEIYTLDLSEMIKIDLLGKWGTDSLLSHDGDIDWFDPGATVTVSAHESHAYRFLGWSTGGYLEDGGRLVSEYPEYTFEIGADAARLYANFQKAEQYTIVYHVNGGRINGSDEETIEVKLKRDTIYTCRNTLHSDGTFIRDGYVAVGYSTQPVKFEDYTSVNDIPGFSNMGGVCVVPDDTCLLDLYVVWARVTGSGFQIKTENGEATVEKYSGSDKILVIPETYNGYPVTTVKSGAISGDKLRCVVLPRTVKTLQGNAFNGCPNLTQLVFFDGITTVSNQSFYGTGKLSTLVMNAQQLPKYSSETEGMFCVKYERVKTAPGKMLVVVSGSSTLYGMVSEEVQRQYPDYTIINYGTNAGTQSYFYLSVIANYVGEGDIVIHAGEHTVETLGSNQLKWKIFRGNEQCYDIFREVDMTKFTNFWNAFAEFQRDRASRTSHAYQYNGHSLNKYGDIISKNVSKYSLSQVNYASPGSYLTAQNAGRLNSVNRIITERGGVMLASFPTLDIAAATNASRENYNKYNKHFRDLLDYPLISDVATYTMESKYFCNSQWHCSEAGAEIRTENLLSDLKAYFDNPDKY